MNIDFRNVILATLAGFMLVMLCAIKVMATQPECTGDRHYDGIGCCLPPVECPTCESGEACEPVLPCPDPAPCQPVTCENGDDGDTTVVTVDRCPEPEVLEFCKVKKNGTTVCVRSKKTRGGRPGPRRLLVPRSIMEKVADQERGY